MYDLIKVYKTQLYKNEPEKILANLKTTSAGFRIFSKPLINEDLNFDYKQAEDEGGEKIFRGEKQKKYFTNPPN